MRARVLLARREAVLRRLGNRTIRLRHATSPVAPVEAPEKAPG